MQIQSTERNLNFLKFLNIVLFLWEIRLCTSLLQPVVKVEIHSEENTSLGKSDHTLKISQKMTELIGELYCL